MSCDSTNTELQFPVLKTTLWEAIDTVTVHSNSEPLCVHMNACTHCYYMHCLEGTSTGCADTN